VEHGRVDRVRRQRRSPRGEARGGGLDPATVSHHRWQGQAMQANRRRGAMAEERGVWLWLTLTKPYRRMGLASRMGRQPGHSFQAWLEQATCSCGQA
jgi:hypothetical protein